MIDVIYILIVFIISTSDKLISIFVTLISDHLTDFFKLFIVEQVDCINYLLFVLFSVCSSSPDSSHSRIDTGSITFEVIKILSSPWENAFIAFANDALGFNARWVEIWCADYFESRSILCECSQVLSGHKRIFLSFTLLSWNIAFGVDIFVKTLILDGHWIQRTFLTLWWEWLHICSWKCVACRVEARMMTHFRCWWSCSIRNSVHIETLGSILLFLALTDMARNRSPWYLIDLCCWISSAG